MFAEKQTTKGTKKGSLNQHQRNKDIWPKKPNTHQKYAQMMFLHPPKICTKDVFAEIKAPKEQKKKFEPTPKDKNAWLTKPNTHQKYAQMMFLLMSKTPK